MSDKDDKLAKDESVDEKSKGEEVEPTPPSPDEDSEESNAPEKTEESTDENDEESDESTEDEDKPAEADSEEPTEKEAPEEEAQAEPSVDEARQTRKERREERKERYIDSIRKEQLNRNTPLNPDEPYSPLDYAQAEQFEVDQLSADREKYGQAKAKEAAQVERYIASQENFLDRISTESKIVESNPKYAFLKQGGEDFDPDLAGEINEKFYALAGYKEQPIVDPNTGYAKIDPQTGQPVVRRSFGRTDLSYEQFVKREVELLERYADTRQADTVKNLAAQRSKAGVRPSGTSRQGLGALKEGDISNMSDEEFEKRKDEINRQISQMTG